ncbi:MAG: response regulator [Pseudomonadota bacterium]
MNPIANVLIVEDEHKIASLLSDYLEQAGYATAIIGDGKEALDALRAAQPDLVILDLMLPGLDGMTVCREVRQFSDVPIMMLTARVEEIDRLLGLELGADDYVCKPFSPREVVARVKVILRRAQWTPDMAEGALHYRHITLDEERFECRVEGTPVTLTPVEFRLLAALLRRPGRVLSRDQLMGQAYTDQRVVSARTIDTHIKNLRAKLTAIHDDDLIHAVYGIGYKVS